MDGGRSGKGDLVKTGGEKACVRTDRTPLVVVRTRAGSLSPLLLYYYKCYGCFRFRSVIRVSFVMSL